MLFPICVSGLVPVKVWREIVRIGVPSAVQNLILRRNFDDSDRLITGWGVIWQAAQRVGSQIESVSWMVGDGFSAAVNAFLGQNYGAKRGVTVPAALFLCDRDDPAAWGLCDIFADRNGASAVLIFAGRRGHGDRRQLPADRGTEPDVYDGGTDLDRCVFSGLGRTLYPSIVSVTFYLCAHPVAVLLSSVMGLSGIWWALSISSMVKGCILFVSFVVFLYVFGEKER